MLTKELFDQTVALLLPDMGDANARQALVEGALYGCPVLQKIQWDGAARPFTVQLVRLLNAYGELEPGRPALGALLEEVKTQVGADRAAQIDQLLALLQTPLAKQAIQLPPKTFAEGELYVFISYARPDQAVAEKVEAFLTAAGVRVFRDTSDIGAGDNWDMAIERALQECQCMVLLLSASSMPFREEVHREWFNFDRKGKKIYPLYIQDCQLHSRFDSRNYLDARTDLPGALERLVEKLRRDFDLPATPAGAAQVGITAGGEKEAQLDPLTEYHQGRIAEWSQARYQLDQRFVNLTLTLDRPEDQQQRWHRVAAPPMKDLREVLEKAKEHPALVLLGAPGSGKSTLLRRLQLDHSRDRLQDGAAQLSFFVQLNEHRGELPPREWLAAVWQERYPRMPSLEDLLPQGRLLLLLDALNEMQPRVGSYADLIAEWRAFVLQTARTGNRLVFSCRSRDLGAAQLGSKDLPVPQIDVQPMTAEQVREFLRVYAAEHQERIWRELDGSKQFDLFRTPYFLKLLCDQVGPGGELPKGRAGLFTGFVRQVLDREKDGALFQPGALLTVRDRQKMAGSDWRDAFDLPARGALIPKLTHLAFAMQQDGAEVSIDYDEACRRLADERAEDILKAGVELNLLDEARDEIKFFHQLLQEYFAARRLAKEPNPTLVQVEWEAEKVSERLEATLAKLADGDPLPPLPQTGWEETALTAAPMATDPPGFIRALIAHNLPLAARCAASPEVQISDELKQEIRLALIARTQEMKADLRARIAAGEALGTLGDPRFARRRGAHGDYLLPPLVEIPGGTYPMGDDKGEYEREKPAHQITLPTFQIGQFPVTNAEYKLFIEADGYEDEQWWETPESLAWRSREASSEGAKQSWRDDRKTLQSWSEDYIRGLVKQNRITSKQAEDWITIRNWTDERFEQQLEEWYPSGKSYHQPEFWDDTRFNNPAQPVVGVTWFEARAYCNWLTANAADGKIYRLPTEAEFEAAARGKRGRMFPYGKTFDATKCNTFESHLRRTTPVGVFDNATPEGAFDLSGNAYSWTLSIYDQERFRYPYRSDDGREDIEQTSVRRVLRGGAWSNNHLSARAVYRYLYHPAVRNFNVGFRVVVVLPPS